MGRRKKEEAKKKKSEEEEPAFEWQEVLGSDAKRSIAAVFLFTSGVLFFIAFFDAGGALGSSLDGFVGSAFGWGKWLFPVLLFVAAAFFLRARETTLADIVKFIGLGVVFLSVLGFLHLFQGDDAKELLKEAKRGAGGGYVGYAVSYPFISFTGKIAGTVILFALLLSGLIAAFNVSIMHFLSSVIRKVSRRGEEDSMESVQDVVSDDDAGAVTEGPAEAAPMVSSLPLQEEPKKDVLEENNIKGIKFPEEERESDSVSVSAESVVFPDAGTAELAGQVHASSSRSRRRKKTPSWELPSFSLLESKSEQENSGNIERSRQIIQSTLRYFGVQGEMSDTTVGPTVTQYTFSPAVGTRLSKITSLGNDLSLALAKHPIRIEAPIPGKSLVGIEVPNDKQARVRMRDILESDTWRSRKSRNLSFVLGEDVSGDFKVADLESMPHLLIAGRTGSGKSVCINSLLLSLLCQNSPEELQLILVDPKRVELSLYNGLPHVKSGRVIVDNKHVVNALRYAVSEMERRYKVLESVHARDITSYHEKYLRGERRRVTDEEGRPHEEDLDPLPYIVVVIDEMADLMIAHGKEVEGAIVRLAQMSRAVGIHLVLATQKPVAEVVTGLIKSNIPAKIAFSVSNQMDSRIILDTGGAEKLLGKGDMLYSPPGASQPQRIQGVFVDDREVRRVVDFLVEQKKELGAEEIGEDFGGEEKGEQGTLGFGGGSGDVDFSSLKESPNDLDDKYDEAKHLVIESGRAATTFLQRRLSIGYGRAAKLLDLLEENGIVGPPDGANKGRQVLVGKGAGESGEAEYDDPLTDQAARDKWQI